jgi:hypothetical protein
MNVSVGRRKNKLGGRDIEEGTKKKEVNLGRIID